MRFQTVEFSARVAGLAFIDRAGMHLRVGTKRCVSPERILRVLNACGSDRRRYRPASLYVLYLPFGVIPLQVFLWNFPIGILPVEFYFTLCWNCPILPVDFLGFPLATFPLKVSLRHVPCDIFQLEFSNSPNRVPPMELSFGVFPFARPMGNFREGNPHGKVQWKNLKGTSSKCNCPNGRLCLKLSYDISRWTSSIGIVH